MKRPAQQLVLAEILSYTCYAFTANRKTIVPYAELGMWSTEDDGQ